MKKLVLSTLAIAATLSTSVFANDLRVTRDNFVQAETSKYYAVTLMKAGGVNKFKHYLVPPETESQPIVRMNRDTLYSTAVLDASKGGTITIPEVGDRYVSVHFVDENHISYDMFYGPGTYKVPTSTNFMFVNVRFGLRDINDKNEIAEINKLQKSVVLKMGSANEYVPFNPDLKALAAGTEVIKEELLLDVQKLQLADSAYMFGTPDYTKPEYHLMGVAYGWGGASYKDNIYQYSRFIESEECHATTFPDPKNDGGFWSMTVYNSAGFMYNDKATINSNIAVANKDGTFTVHFGCDGKANNIPTKGHDGSWNVLVRHYTPSARVKDLNIDPSKTIAPVK
ncbi:DUF1254 domain-containing protein [Thalassotalea psychrophila]|uniref:DUF1254 domain-containing protein n=1 Tax=Thalassotalea psychrophila TaxID=3065647 RepID=A0ABY9TYH2_9GAMM|nr:DUF1254 domain-containing protein [Colwelliaceae bacterium SQ149]